MPGASKTHEPAIPRSQQRQELAMPGASIAATPTDPQCLGASNARSQQRPRTGNTHESAMPGTERGPRNKTPGTRSNTLRDKNARARNKTPSK